MLAESQRGHLRFSGGAAAFAAVEEDGEGDGDGDGDWEGVVESLDLSPIKPTLLPPKSSWIIFFGF